MSSVNPQGFEMPIFDTLVFHPTFEDHQAKAGRRVVTEAEAEQAWYGTREFVRNKKSGRGPYLMVGITGGGRDITVVLLTTRIPTVWCGYTAWDT